MASNSVVLDIGKTHAKLTLWTAAGEMIDRRTGPSPTIAAPSYSAIDVEALETWLGEGLADLARQGPIGAIVPVAHGAAAALLAGGRLFAPPVDYEHSFAPDERAVYVASRDAFAATGSPLLPAGLNLGLQLHHLESIARWPDDLQIVTWPQYWAWRLSGVAATEVSSLGCHTDLWQPFGNCPSALADARGWAARLAPRRRADEALGPVTAEWRARAGLPGDCRVYCGLHDSNAALQAARTRPELAGRDVTVLSTGTWFIAMRSPAAGAAIDVRALDPRRDCLVNVDIDGRPVPSSRFMGGRERELLLTAASPAPVEADDRAIDAVRRLVAAGAMALPSFAPGTGPFPDSAGQLVGIASDAELRVAASLYLALVADASLDLIASHDSLVVGGRFAEDRLFVRALASLRPDQQVLAGGETDDVAFGALRLAVPDVPGRGRLEAATALPVDLEGYRAAWRRMAKPGRTA